MATIFRLLRYPRARALSAWMSELVPSSKPLLMRLTCQEMIPSQCSSTDLTNSFNGSEPVAGDRPRAADRLVEDAFGHGRNLLMEAKGDRRPGGAIATGKLAVHVHLDSLPGVAEAADHLHLRPHSGAELVERAVAAGYLHWGTTPPTGAASTCGSPRPAATAWTCSAALSWPTWPDWPTSWPGLSPSDLTRQTPAWRRCKWTEHVAGERASCGLPAVESWHPGPTSTGVPRRLAVVPSFTATSGGGHPQIARPWSPGQCPLLLHLKEPRMEELVLAVLAEIAVVALLALASHLWMRLQSPQPA